MPPILIYYLTGLSLALVVGIVCYLVAGPTATPFLTSLFGRRSGPMWGRLFRISLVSIALVGGLSTKFYGCGGPTDYGAVANNHETMLVLTSEQVSGAATYSTIYLVVAAALGALAFAIYQARVRPR